jgi:hypothetical protein
VQKFLDFIKKICYNIYIKKNKKSSKKAPKKIKKILDTIKKICYNNNIEKQRKSSK